MSPGVKRRRNSLHQYGAVLLLITDCSIEVTGTDCSVEVTGTDRMSLSLITQHPHPKPSAALESKSVLSPVWQLKSIQSPPRSPCTFQLRRLWLLSPYP